VGLTRIISGQVRFVLILSVLLTVSAGCSLLLLAPTPTPPAIPTPTQLERERDAIQNSFDQATPADAWLVQRGVRVIQPESASIEAPSDCPSTFPIVGVAYGVYYLPSDELYPKPGELDSLLNLRHCFAAEQDAINAGYRRGPH
jgi:hypothetical protein